LAQTVINLNENGDGDSVLR